VGDDALNLIVERVLKVILTSVKHTVVGDDVFNLIVERLLEITAASV